MKPFDQYEIDWDIDFGTWDVNHGTWDIYETIKSNTILKGKKALTQQKLTHVLKDTPPPTPTK